MAQSEIDFPNLYNRELVLDLTLQAFYVYSFDHVAEDANSPRIHDYIPISDTVKQTVEDVVLDNAGNIVVDSLGNNVTINVKITVNRTRESRRENFKFLTSQGNTITVSEFKDYSFKDFLSYNGTGFNFDSFLVTGYDISQDFLRKKQAIYLLVYCERTETIYGLDSLGNVALQRPSSCLVQSRWEWNNSAAQGKWGTQFQAYRLLLPQPASPASGDPFDYGPIVIETKNKLRGSGKSLSLYFQSEAGKDMKLLGWGILGYRVDEP